MVDVVAGRVGDPTDVVVQGGIIRAVGRQGKPAPDESRTIDFSGRFVLPGFIEMHAHVPLNPWLPDGDIARQFDREASLQILAALLANGVTTVRDPGSPTETAVTLRWFVAEGKVIGPGLVTAGRMLNGTVDWLNAFDPGGHTAQTIASEMAAAKMFVVPTLITIHSKFFGNEDMYRDPAERHLVPDVFWNGWERAASLPGGPKRIIGRRSAAIPVCLSSCARCTMLACY